MPKLIPVPDLWASPSGMPVNQRRLVMQQLHCLPTGCNHPPQQAYAQVCNSAAGLTWKEVEEAAISRPTS